MSKLSFVQPLTMRFTKSFSPNSKDFPSPPLLEHHAVFGTVDHLRPYADMYFCALVYFSSERSHSFSHQNLNELNFVAQKDPLTDIILVKKIKNNKWKVSGDHVFGIKETYCKMG